MILIEKFWANNNPYTDFKKTVELTADLVYNWNYEKFIQISTISTENPKNSPYGINKKAAELISNYKKSLIVRLGTIYGVGLQKGPLYDLLAGNKLYVDIKSRYDFIDVDFCAKWIFKNLHQEDVVSLGANDTTSLQEISEKLNIKPIYQGEEDFIFSENTESGMPSSKEVYSFIESHYKNK